MVEPQGRQPSPTRRAPGRRRERPPPSLSEGEIAHVRSLVICEDAAILAIDKPSGLSSQGGRGQVNTLDELLYAFARPDGRRPQLVHRLDRDTSGVILAAKTKPAAGALGKAFAARAVRKTYLALVPPGEAASGVIDAPLRREEAGREAYMRIAAPGAGGAEPALTRFRTLARGPAGALVEVRPETGRMHQIRVHMAHIGRPLFGDVRYGGALTAGGAPAPRLMLHALAIDAPHPAGGRRRYAAPPPADMAEVARACGIDLARAVAPLLDEPSSPQQG
ncbi:MAG: RluA family pseudouridine synthase [Caulobacteraceae bacterium]|nr:RluA family pseudouridine synthase [Caulobacter sp.]